MYRVRLVNIELDLHSPPHPSLLRRVSMGRWEQIREGISFALMPKADVDPARYLLVERGDACLFKMQAD